MVDAKEVDLSGSDLDNVSSVDRHLLMNYDVVIIDHKSKITVS